MKSVVSFPQSIRPPAVAGQFYPADPKRLQKMVEDFLKQAQSENFPERPVKALIAPHAGFVYSGPIAASAYKTLLPQADQIRRVVLLGPSHRVAFRGLAATSARSYRTPLGDIPVDQAAISSIAQQGLPQLQIRDEAHAFEHSLEVQLPFLQLVLSEFRIVPLVVGDASAQDVAGVIEALWGTDETLIVVSSDLSHYLPYPAAQRRDQKTAEAICRFEPDKIAYDDACGRNPIKGLLLAAHRHGLGVRMLDLRNSGDTAGSRDRVVGYGAWIFS